MTAVHSPGKVLVTGANGYIGMWIVRILLEQGYIVRGAVRSQSKGKYLTSYFQQMGFGADKLEIVIVDDLTKQGAFDQAVQGVDAIQHVAAPVDIEVSNPQDFMKPAVQGTVGVLQSVFEHGNNVR
ncbi:hypothetical protein NP233_g8630 [Leucocoprinus birnbaumii]|uniref:NAD(P)-binding domain-containing protein n=1 Tax=Leucocoprinus birnbaumii TaxID=56174 RepID=A0AAD5VLY0_9AGAR|nr:hypothetical protein NP233_g8630 [Leucocoprinus birnbaumii]